MLDIALQQKCAVVIFLGSNQHFWPECDKVDGDCLGSTDGKIDLTNISGTVLSSFCILGNEEIVCNHPCEAWLAADEFSCVSPMDVSDG